LKQSRACSFRPILRTTSPQLAAPAAVDRIDAKSAVRLSVDVLAAEPPFDVHRFCEAEFEAARRDLGLSNAFVLTWIHN
jgi:hypothetical protein